MSKKQKVDLTSIEDKIEKASFELFRFWTDSLGISESLEIKTEQRLVADLTYAIIGAISSLNETEDLEEKPYGWDVGFVIGFIDGNLGKNWYHQYIVENSKDYKTFVGLKAVQTYLEIDEITRIKIDAMYQALFEKDSNVLNPDVEVKGTDLSGKELEIVPNSKSGKVLTILNNVILECIKVIAEKDDSVRLPIRNVFTIVELQKLIADNKKKLE